MLDKGEYIPWNKLTDALKNNERQTERGSSLELFEGIVVDQNEQRVFTEVMHSMGIQLGR
ncbi:hypothetical protein [Bacillus cereus]|uniref:hypothetical protein n=1 Tax=Bacillus cereus TaxID=1396 RepID=UPI003D998FC6